MGLVCIPLLVFSFSTYEPVKELLQQDRMACFMVDDQVTG